MLVVLLVVILVILLCGGGYGIRTGAIVPSQPLGVVLTVVLVILIVFLLFTGFAPLYLHPFTR